jgi:glucose/mannose transport system permease protein
MDDIKLSQPAVSGAATAAARPVKRAARRHRPMLTPARIGVYAFLLTAAVIFLIPLYVMVTTSLKSMDEIRLGNLFALPMHLTIQPWISAWTEACTGLACNGIQAGFFNSVKIVIPSTILSIFLGALNGYALSFWRTKVANILFGILLMGAFIPLQVMIFPMVRVLATVHLFSSLPGIVIIHTVFGMPIMTLMFRNYYATIPGELFKAARIDGGGFFRIFLQLMLPMSTPMIIVAIIMQVTGIWNDFILGLVFAGVKNLPMTVQLNNIINTTTGERLYNVNMAATILTSAVPLLIYLISGRWFVRGIASGAVKG